MSKCGFCNDSEVVLTYSKPPEWGACKRCRMLVDKAEYKQLLNLMSISWWRKYPEDRKKQGIYFIRQMTRKIISVFMGARGIIPFE